MNLTDSLIELRCSRHPKSHLLASELSTYLSALDEGPNVRVIPPPRALSAGTLEALTIAIGGGIVSRLVADLIVHVVRRLAGRPKEGSANSSSVIVLDLRNDARFELPKDQTECERHFGCRRLPGQSVNE